MTDVQQSYNKVSLKAGVTLSIQVWQYLLASHSGNAINVWIHYSPSLVSLSSDSRIPRLMPLMLFVGVCDEPAFDAWWDVVSMTLCRAAEVALAFSYQVIDF